SALRRQSRLVFPDQSRFHAPAAEPEESCGSVYRQPKPSLLPRRPPPARQPEERIEVAEKLGPGAVQEPTGGLLEAEEAGPEVLPPALSQLARAWRELRVNALGRIWRLERPELR